MLTFRSLKYGVLNKPDWYKTDEELEELLIYRETRKTGYTALTQHAQTFKEIFGNDIEVQNPSIEELMIYLEKYKSKSSKPLTLESEDKK